MRQLPTLPVRATAPQRTRPLLSSRQDAPATLGTQELLVTFIAFVLSSGAFSVILVLVRAPMIGWDAANYELISGYGFLHGLGRLSSLPGQLQTYTDTEINALYYALFAHTSFSVMASIIAFLEALGIAVLMLVVYIVVRTSGVGRRFCVLIALGAGFGGMVVPTYVAELGGTQSDSISLLPVVIGGGLLYWAIGSVARQRSGLISALIGGASLGVALALKLTNGPWVGGLLLGFAAGVIFGLQGSHISIRKRMLSASVPLFACLVATALVYAPVGVYLWDHYHNPLFPYFGAWFHSPLLQRHNFRDTRYTVSGLHGIVSHFSELLTGTMTHLDSFPVRSPLVVVGLLLVAASFVVSALRLRDARMFFIQISVLVGFTLWLLVFGYYRYLAVFEIAIPSILIVLGVLHGLRPLLAMSSVVLVTAVCLLFSWYPNYGSWYPPAAHVSYQNSYFGVASTEFRFLQGDHVVLTGGYPTGFVDLYLPHDAVVTGVGSNLFGVMNSRWQSETARKLLDSTRPLYLVDAQPDLSVAISLLDELGLRSTLGSCRYVPSKVYVIAACHLSVVRRR